MFAVAINETLGVFVLMVFQMVSSLRGVIVVMISISVGFGIAMYPRDVLLARDALREASDAAFGTFLPSGEMSIGSTEDLDKLSHDELYNRQCVTGSGAREEGINSRVLLMCCRNGTRPTDFHGCQRQ